MIRVLVVDDSTVFRRLVTTTLEHQPDITVIGGAANPYEARDMIVALRPDVVTLDVVMPRMDGLTFLAKLMQHYPVPVVVVSSFGAEADVGVRAFAAGAVGIVTKPGRPSDRETMSRDLVEKIRLASRSGPFVPRRPVPVPSQQVIAIGASTGGTEAIQTVLSELSVESPGILIAQHMLDEFRTSFAKRLDLHCAVTIREAEAGDQVTDGTALLAPGDRHMILDGGPGHFRVHLEHGPHVNHHRPSIDVLFRSVAERARARAIGVLLTGMGTDGALGLLAIRESGARTMAQDEASCVVFGMPREAIKIGAAEAAVPLPRVAAEIQRHLLSARATTSAEQPAPE